MNMNDMAKRLSAGDTQSFRRRSVSGDSDMASSVTRALGADAQWGQQGAKTFEKPEPSPRSRTDLMKAAKGTTRPKLAQFKQALNAALNECKQMDPQLRAERGLIPLDKKDGNEQTALMLAVLEVDNVGIDESEMQTEMIEMQFQKVDLLATNGANVFAIDSSNETAVQLAGAKNWHKAVLRMTIAFSQSHPFVDKRWHNCEGLVPLRVIEDHCPPSNQEAVINSLCTAYGQMEPAILLEYVSASFVTRKSINHWRRATLNAVRWSLVATKRAMDLKQSDAPQS